MKRTRPAEQTHLSVPLPRHFRAADILAFHQRDPLGVAERVDGPMLYKGLMWQGQAACLTICFQARHAEVTLAVDGIKGACGTAALERMVRRMLGLTQPIEVFERTYRRHPVLGPLIARHPGLRVPLTATPFEALTWAITGQQISVRAAVSVRRKLIQKVGLCHSSDLFCYPDAAHLATLVPSELRAVGYSLTKAHTLLALSQQVNANQLPLERWQETLPIDDMRTQLARVRGIGPWTINYALLRGFGWLDGSLHGDVAVRRNLQAILGASDKLTEAQALTWLADFSPWRALVAAHLWAS